MKALDIHALPEVGLRYEWRDDEEWRGFLLDDSTPGWDAGWLALEVGGAVTGWALCFFEYPQGFALPSWPDPLELCAKAEALAARHPQASRGATSTTYGPN